MTSNNYKQKASGHVTSLANGHFTGSDAPFVCEIPTAWSNKKRCNFADTGLAMALLQRWHVSSVRVSLANGTKRTPSQNWGNLLLQLHVPHRQCLASISNAFSASFTSTWPSFSRFYCTPNKACLLCATPAGTYRVQSPRFPKIVYYKTVSTDHTFLKRRGSRRGFEPRSLCLPA